MTESADIQTRRKENILTVPLNSVTTRDKKEMTDDKGKAADTKTKPAATETEGTPGNDEDDSKEVVVFVYDAKTLAVKMVKVTTGIQDTRHIEITGGLQQGAEVVSEPYNTFSAY